jgi:hypothetical protein
MFTRPACDVRMPKRTGRRVYKNKPAVVSCSPGYSLKRKDCLLYLIDAMPCFYRLATLFQANNAACAELYLKHF